MVAGVGVLGEARHAREGKTHTDCSACFFPMLIFNLWVCVYILLNLLPWAGRGAASCPDSGLSLNWVGLHLLICSMFLVHV